MTIALRNCSARSIGSSPLERTSVKMFLPSLTTTVPVEFRPYPRLIIATCRPSDNSIAATFFTIGVFPVPPVVMLPIEITGTPTSIVRKKPISKNQFRSSVANANKGTNGKKNQLGFTPIHLFQLRILMPAQSIPSSFSA